jgi:serine/threonine-protein kinase RsbW
VNPQVSGTAAAAGAQCNLWLNADNSFSEAVTCFVEALARQAQIPGGKAYWLRLATEEIMTNITQHGYHGRGPVWLTGGIKPDIVWLRIEDRAPAFDPMTHNRHSQLAVDPTERKEGGFGLLLALHKLDGFSYEYADGKNRNTLIMCRTPANAGGPQTNGNPDGRINRSHRR